MLEKTTFSQEVLNVNAATEVARIGETMRHALARDLRRRGTVVAISGGVDSSVVAALCVQALGRDRVVGLLLPERESSQATRDLGRAVVEHLGIQSIEQDITPILEAAGCYQLRDEAIRRVIPDYGPQHKCKIALPELADDDHLRVFSVIVQSPDGQVCEARLSHEAYLAVVAASNFKQRVRKMLEYYRADRLNYAVVGTPNRLEYDQGFFVKLGDGAADIKPIAHLYKTQVYQLAEYLDVPKAVREQPPTTDTYSMPQTQEEFYFSLPYDKLDLCLYARNHSVPAEQAAAGIGLRPEQVERVFRDIDQKRRSTRYLHLAPLLVEPVNSAER